MDEKQFEIKLSTAVILFATQLQNIMESSSDVLAELLVAKVETNPNMSIEQMTEEIASHVVVEISKEFKLDRSSTKE